MATKNRASLRGFFKGGSVPTERDFGHLIDSALNKIDDQFFGKWSPNFAYRQGDVVVFGCSMYQLQLPADSASDTWCSDQNPEDDCLHWKQLEFKTPDDDWVIPKDEHYIYAHPERAQKVGIGINRPEPNKPEDRVEPDAQVQIHHETRGDIRFNPDDSGPQTLEIRLESFDNDCQPESFLSLKVDGERARLQTNASAGFVLDFFPTDAKNPNDPDLAFPLLSAQQSSNGAQVGIGTATPSGAIDAVYGMKGRFEVMPDDAEEAEIRLTNSLGIAAPQTLRVDVGADFADFSTDAAGGFRFQKIDDQANVQQVAAKNSNPADNEVVVIDLDGNLGVGTPTPSAKLHVTDGFSGDFKVDFVDHLPIASLEQRVDDEDPHVMRLGIGRETAIIQTNAGCGFAITTMPQSGDFSEGDTLFASDAEGHASINGSPQNVNLAVHGNAQQKESYLLINDETMRDKLDLSDDDALEAICALKAIKFKWNNPEATLQTDGFHYGFETKGFNNKLLHGQRKSNKDGKTKALNYNELVPLLVKVVQQQQERIEALEKALSSSKY